MLTDSQRQAIAAELEEAERTHELIERITARFPDAEIEDSYAVQAAWRQRREAAGLRVLGHKIGLTSKAMQAATGITEPDYGVMLTGTVFESGCVLDFDAYTNVRIEVELAFHLRRDLTGPGCTVLDVLDATDYVTPALEVLNSHIQLEGRTIVDTIADNAAYGAMVTGGRPVRPDAVDLRWAGAMLYRGETIEETGLAGGVLGHPATGVAWLANKLAAHGEVLRAGELILAGSFTRPMWVSRGDSVVADYGRLGTVTCSFQ